MEQIGERYLLLVRAACGIRQGAHHFRMKGLEVRLDARQALRGEAQRLLVKLQEREIGPKVGGRTEEFLPRHLQRGVHEFFIGDLRRDARTQPQDACASAIILLDDTPL
jgi:hypothetical protein